MNRKPQESAMSEGPTVKFLRLRPHAEGDIPFPSYMTPGASGMDICAAVEGETVLAPGEIRLIPMGFAVSIPPGYEAQIRPRSGLAVQYGIGIINSPGTIDADYRGEVMVALINHGKRDFIVRRGDRIAQMIVQRVYRARIEPVTNLDKTSRDAGGFGHTGIQSDLGV